MSRHLIVSAYWSDEPMDDALAHVREAYGPLKAEGTRGFAEAWPDDQDSQEFWQALHDHHEKRHG